MQTITTRRIPASNTRPAYIVATASGSRTRHSTTEDNDKDGPARHWPAAQALAKQLGWTGTMQAGATREGYVFSFIDTREQFTI